MKCRDKKNGHHRDERNPLQDAQRTRILLLDVLQVQREGEQPGADQKACGITDARRHGYAGSLPRANTHSHGVSDAAAGKRAVEGIFTSRSHCARLRYILVSNMPAFIPATRISMSFSRCNRDEL